MLDIALFTLYSCYMEYKETRPKLLISGIDTLEIAYFLHPHQKEGHIHAENNGIDFQKLAFQKEELRQSKQDKKAITLGGETFLLRPSGKNRKYTFLIENENFKIGIGEFIDPPFHVTFKSAGLWYYSAKTLHEKFLSWTAKMGYKEYRPESVSRADLAFDFFLALLDFDKDSFVSLADTDNQYRKYRKTQTFNIGGDDILLRVYNKVAEIKGKSGKVWFYELWGRETDVWRVEWQLRKDFLRSFKIRTLDDLYKYKGDMLQYLCTKQTTLRIPSNDSNRSRWSLHPLWIELQNHIQSLEQFGASRNFDREAVLEAIKVRMAISMYGYLKKLSAIESIQQGKEILPIGETIESLSEIIRELHDPLNWQSEVHNKILSIQAENALFNN